MRLVKPSRRRFFWAVSGTGALMATVAIQSGSDPGTFPQSLRSGGLASIVFVAALIVLADRVFRRSSFEQFRWAGLMACLVATADVFGDSFAAQDRLLAAFDSVRGTVWFVTRWVGIAWVCALALTAVLVCVESGRLLDRTVESTPGVQRIRRVDLIATLRSENPRTRLRSFAVLSAAVIAARIPYVVVYWPGIMPLDTFRSVAYSRGVSPWDSYEPVGSSLLIVACDRISHALGWGDMGMVALGSLSLILATSFALAFMLQRMAVWRVGRAVWWGSLVWVIVLPAIGFASIAPGKDGPFAAAFVVFVVCLGELAYVPGSRHRRWPWVTIGASGAVLLVTRNNGSYVVFLTLLVLLILFRSHWRIWIRILSVVLAVFAIYVGPVYAALGVGPGRAVESYSIPLQQLARISRDDAGSLRPEDRRFITDVFSGRSPEKVAPHYVPGLSDPVKLFAMKDWGDRSTGQFAAGWLRVVARHPRTAVEATLAGTLGYWDPVGRPYDRMFTWTTNGVRGIYLAIPTGPQHDGLAGWINRSGILPGHDYRRGTPAAGWFATPVLAVAMSPGAMCWAWLIAAAIALRRRVRESLLVIVPMGVLLLTLLAGPVSGGQRYSLPFFMLLPVAVATAALGVDRSSRGEHTRLAE